MELSPFFKPNDQNTIKIKYKIQRISDFEILDIFGFSSSRSLKRYHKIKNLDFFQIAFNKKNGKKSI